MKIVWTKSPNVVDWLIARFTGEDCGHLALVFESARGGGALVFESNLLGCHPAFYTTWMKHGREIVHQWDLRLTTAQEDRVWDEWVTTFDGKGYDLAGALFLGLMKLRQRVFGTALPTRNRWAKHELFFCDEVFQLLQGLPGVAQMDYRLNGMSTPHDVWVTIDKAHSGSV